MARNVVVLTLFNGGLNGGSIDGSKVSVSFS
jgi:hypothetical protein